MSEEAKIIHLPPREYRRVVEAVQDVERLLAGYVELFEGQEEAKQAYILLLRLANALLTAEPSTLPNKVAEFVDALATLAVSKGAPTKEDAGGVESLKAELETSRGRLAESGRERDEYKTRTAELNQALATIETERVALKTRVTELEARLPEIDRLTTELRVLAERDRLLARVEALLGKAAPVETSPVVDPSFVEKVTAELGRRKQYFLTLNAQADEAMADDDELKEAIEECQAKRDMAEGDALVVLQTRLRELEARQQKLDIYLSSLSELRELQGKAIQALEKFLEAHRRVLAGPPPELLGADLPPLPELEEAPVGAIEKHTGAESVYDEKRFRRLVAIAKKVGLTPEIVLIVSLYDALGETRGNLNKGALIRPHFGPPRIVRAAQQVGIIQVFGWKAVREFLKSWWGSQSEEQDKLRRELLLYTGSPKGAGQTFCRSKKPLPWTLEEILSAAEIANLREAVKIVKQPPTPA